MGLNASFQHAVKQPTFLSLSLSVPLPLSFSLFPLALSPAMQQQHR